MMNEEITTPQEALTKLQQSGEIPSFPVETPLESESSEKQENSANEPKPDSICLPGTVPNESFREKLFRLDHSHHQRVVELLKWGEWFFRQAINNDRSAGISLILCGDVGTGKSTVAKKVWKQCGAWGVEAMVLGKWNAHPSTCWVDWPSLCEADHEFGFSEKLQDVADAKIVFLDDVGSESERFKNGDSASRLRRTLVHCENKWLLVTTNLSKESFLDLYDYRVADRLSAAHWCDLSGVPSYRPKLKGQVK